MDEFDTKSQIIATVKSLGKGNVSRIVQKLPKPKTRQWVSALLKQLAKDGALIRSKEGKQVFYVLPDRLDLLGKRTSRRLVNRSLSEDQIFEALKNQTPFIKDLKEDVGSITYYGFTEMLNNAIDHSLSRSIEVVFEELGDKITFDVIDRGIGVFRNIMNKKHLPTELDALQDLLKGKTTTLPRAHTGEGIFFTSKIADVFVLDSYGYRLRVDNALPDIFVEKVNKFEGTKVHFELATKSNKHLGDIFKEYEAEPNSQAFDKTKVLVKLLRAGTVYISRSQAKRLMNNLESFKLVVLDFEGVDMVGQAFADEVLRVFANKYPQTKIETINMSETVKFMMGRVQSLLV